jgi:hypothetical protein
MLRRSDLICLAILAAIDLALTAWAFSKMGNW